MTSNGKRLNVLCDVLCTGQFYEQFAMQMMLHVGIHFIDVEVRFTKLVLSLYPCFLSFQNVESYVSKSYVLSYVLKITMHELIQTQFLIHSPLGNLTSVLTKTLLA